MKKTLRYFYIPIFVGLLFLASCNPNTDDNNTTPGAGSADFTSYVAVGNSLTAGYADGALCTSGQKVGWANILSQQLKTVGMTTRFSIPLMPTEDGVGASEGSTGIPVLRTKYVLGYTTDCLGNKSVGPVPANPGTSQAELYFYLITSVAQAGPYHNLGIPGIRVTDLFKTNLATTNPFFTRIAYHPTDTLETYAAKVKPTFFSLWIGNNDVLGYAASGGTGTITPMDGPAGTGFKASLDAEVKYLVGLTGEGVIADIPDITSVPYFNTIPYNAIVLTDTTQVKLLNAAYTPYNNAMAALGLAYRINFKLGANPMVIADKDMQLPAAYAKLKFRQMKSDELVILEMPTDSLKCAGWGTQKPVPDEYILTENEIKTVTDATNAFNSLMQEEAKQYNLAFVDFNTIMKEIDKNGGVTEDGIKFTTKFITGNLFGLDGIHLAPRGNALVANYFIDAINKKYGSKIAKVDVSTYPPIPMPAK
jgi:lysophospholipase L1-like esterase